MFVHAYLQVFFFLTVFGSESGCLGLENQAFGKGGIAKINFRRNWISHESWVHFSGFWVALVPIFMILVASRLARNLITLQGETEHGWW